MFCTKCGSEVREGAKFCTKCGNKLENRETVSEPAVERHSKPRPEKVKKVIEKKKKGLPIAAIIAIVLGIVVLLCGTAFGAYYVYNNVLESDSESEDEEDFEEEDVKDEIEEPADEKPAISVDEVEPEVAEAEAPATEEAVEEGNWKQLYIEKLKEFADNEDNGYYPSAGLIFVDDDNIPELILLGADEASGNRVYTCGSGKLEELITSRLGFSYVERKNTFMNSDGHMGYYYDILYTIEDGAWVLKESGSYEENYDNRNPETGYTEYTYYWDNNEVSAQQYRNNLERCYDSEDAVYIPYDYEYSPSQLISDLESGNYATAKTLSLYYIDSAAIHNYDLIIDDVSWYSAKQKCEEMGGYLVRINSREEFDYIANLIKENGMEKNVFWVAGTRSYGEASHYRWVTNDYRSEVAKLDSDPEYKDMWMDNEPSYSGVNMNGDQISEEYMDMFYLKSQDRFVFNDVEEDISPYYPGKVGYICEYE